MKYKVNNTVVHKPEWHNGCSGHKVVEAVANFGMYDMPHYKVEDKSTKSGFVWLREWMLK